MDGERHRRTVDERGEIEGMRQCLAIAVEVFFGSVRLSVTKIEVNRPSYQ
jgi:hypothetical protein